MERIILHCDLNNFYASVECLYNPKLRNSPVAVVGDPDTRHGIVLAKNDTAKKCGVATGNPLWMAKQKCPDIIFVPPHYECYMKYSQIAREIYSEYTDKVEPYGLDECWLDITESTQLFGYGREIADRLRQKIKFELGVTASVGVSFNKIFAKLGSDMKKPDATTVIERSRFHEIVWPLPVNDLLYVGRATHNKLKRHGIETIGNLANSGLPFIQSILGKNGETLWLFANGMDNAPVTNITAKSPIQSIGNSTTTPRDLVTDEDIKITLMALCESVSARMREKNFVCHTVQIGIRDNQLHFYERQGKLPYPNRTAKDLFQKAFHLYCQNRPANPVRSLSVRACRLEVRDSEQLSFLPDIASLQKQEAFENAIDSIRNRFGHFSIQRGMMLTDRQLSNLDPKNDHIIHPESYFK